ncbi:putative methyltransferase-domain-containing protein [Scheffersomyces amazonensis]|uniref:putative methyltransferase-domain-containing protein n=1 Tax=Scheffersomyces amazonensis TaxID=1078765 RepID=UPI00315D5675
MVGKKKRSGLLRRPKSITGNHTVPKSIKPQNARQLIRRFHVLEKNKFSIIDKIKRINNIPNLTTENYREILSKTKLFKDSYDKSFEEHKNTLTKKSFELITIDDSLTESELYQKLASIDAEVEIRGGLKAYQLASTQGQNGKRGGDSSKRLVEWLKESLYSHKLENATALEIGCLSPDNAISTSGLFTEVSRIDLNSQHHLILQQDFMERPLPTDSSEKFNLISCSLVVNFVPDSRLRGEMLLRITKFLKKPTNSSISSLFFVLPLPCVTSSRYFDKDSLNKIMKHLGFTEVHYYEAKKVAYWLYDWSGEVSNLNNHFKKQEIHAGPNKNNFCITL